MGKAHFSAPGLTGEVWSSAERTTPLRLRPSRDKPTNSKTHPKRDPPPSTGRFKCASSARTHRQVAVKCHVRSLGGTSLFSLAPVRPSVGVLPEPPTGPEIFWYFFHPNRRRKSLRCARVPSRRVRDWAKHREMNAAIHGRLANVSHCRAHHAIAPKT
jgi:hypothetical protein